MHDFATRLAAYINEQIVHGNGAVSFPPQGMSSSVFFLFANGIEYAVKYGSDATKDAPAIELIRHRGVRVPVPEVVTTLVFEEVPVLVMKRITLPLLESVSALELPTYVPSMIAVMKELHTITNPKPQKLSSSQNLVSWKDYILSQLDKRTINWTEVLKRDVLDHALVANALERFSAMLISSDLEPSTYALLHTDFNQRNLFVDPTTKTIGGIIDWEDAVFGDPVYDFARIRMFLWHFGLQENIVESYYDSMRYTDDEKRREWLYWTARVIQYLAWYSEENTEFNASRIALHQDYLRAIRW